MERPDGIKALGWAGVGFAAAGGAFALAGLLTNSSVNQDIAAYEAAAANGDRATYDSFAESIPRKQSRGKMLYGIGAVAGTIGVALFVTDLAVGTETVPVEAAVAPTVGGASVQATLRF